MNVAEEEEIKKEFQLERVILFSDAVFAIIITIMVLELKLPESIRNADAEHWKDAFKELIPKFGAYVLSFFLVARFWIGHLKIFKFLKDYDTILLSLNLLFLFSVSLFPFTAYLLSNISHIHSLSTAIGVNIYVIIIFSIMFTQTLLIAYMIGNKEKLCFFAKDIEAQLKWKALRLNLFFIPVLFVLIGIFSHYGLKPEYSLYLAAVYGFTVATTSRKIYASHTNKRIGIGIFKKKLKS